MHNNIESSGDQPLTIAHALIDRVRGCGTNGS